MSTRVIVLAKAFPPNLGGVETYSEQVAFAWARRGADVTVLTQFAGGPKQSARTLGQSTIHVINVEPGPQAIIFRKMVNQLFRLQPSQGTIFHATTWRVSLPTLFFPKIPTLITVHGREVAQTPFSLRPLMRILLARAARILVISRYSKERTSPFSKAIARNSVVSWNGVSWPDMPPVPLLQGNRRGGPLRLLSASQLTRRKNVAAVVHIVKALHDRGSPPFTCMIAGDGPERAALVELARTLGVSEMINFTGKLELEHMPAAYHGADVFLHPQSHVHDSSDFESFCLSVADAMAFGLPTIAGHLGAPAEYITSGRNGWVIDPTNIASATDLVHELLVSLELRRGVGAKAREFALEHFSWDRHIERVASAFKFG